MKENESNYLSINNLDLLVQWDDMRNVFYISGSYLWKSYAGTVTDRLVLDESARLNLKYMYYHMMKWYVINDYLLVLMQLHKW